MLQTINYMIHLGRLQSPYISQVAFAATGMQSRFDTPDGVVNFVFRQDCYFTNSTLNVSSIAIDAGDGLGYRAIQWGNPFTCNYDTEGDKDVKVKFTFSDNSVKYTHFTITVKINTLKSQLDITIPKLSTLIPPLYVPIMGKKPQEMLPLFLMEVLPC